MNSLYCYGKHKMTVLGKERGVGGGRSGQNNIKFFNSSAYTLLMAYCSYILS